MLRRAAVVLALVLLLAKRSDAGDWLFANGFEDNASDTAWWVWTALDTPTTGKQIVTTNHVGGRQSLGLDCSALGRYLFKAFTDPESDGAPATKPAVSFCGSLFIPSGLLSSSGTTDLFGLDQTTTTHVNGQGVALVSAVGRTALTLRGACSSGNYSIDLDDDAWHRYCVQYDGGQAGAGDFVKLWLDADPSTASPTLSCTGDFSIIGDPNGLKISCFKGIEAIPAGDRLFDDLLVRDDLVSQDVLYQGRAGLLAVGGPTDQDCDGAHCDVMGATCSTQTTAPETCINSTYVEPGNGANSNLSSATHNVRLDNAEDYFDVTFQEFSDPYYADDRQVYAVLPEAFALEQNANNQVEMGYDTENSGLYEYGGGVFDWDNALALHRRVLTLESAGHCSNDPRRVCITDPDCVAPGSCSIPRAALNMADLQLFRLRFHKTIGSGNWRMETLYVPYVWIRPRRVASVVGG